MPKNTGSSISVANTPADGDAFAIGETVEFAITGTGVISYVCNDAGGETRLGGGLIRGDLDFVVGMSERWSESPVPLACTASLIEQDKRGNPRTVATTTFEVRP